MRKKKAVYNIVTSITLQAVMIIVNLIVPRLIIQYFGSAMNGLINSITQFLSYISLLESGVGSVVTSKYYSVLASGDNRKLSQIYKESDRFYKWIAYIGVVYVAVLCFVYPLISKTEFQNRTVIILILIISAMSFAQFLFGAVSMSLLQADQKMYIVNTTKIIANILNTALVAIFAWVGANIFIVKGASAITLAAIPIVYYIYTRKYYDIDKRVPRNKELLKDKWDGLGQHIAATIHNNTDVFLLTIFKGDIIVSIYSVYALVTSGLKSVIGALSNGVMAAFGNMIAKHEDEKLKKYYNTFDYLNTIVSFLVFTIAYFMILPFVRLYTSVATDANYIQPAYAAIVMIAEGIYCIRTSYTTIIFAAGHFKQTLKSAYIEAVINVVASLLMVNKYGLVGVGIGTLLAMLFRAIHHIIYLSRNIVFWDIKKVAYRIFINIVALGVVYLSLRSLPYDSISSVWQWIIYAVITTLVCGAEYIAINLLLNRKEALDIYKLYASPMMKKIFKKGIQKKN